jgi:hypothetical protein
MLISIFMIAAISFSGMGLTYLVADDEPFLWRLSAGGVVGSAVFGLIVFIAASLIGFSAATVAASLAITALPVALLRKAGIRRSFLHDWAKAKGKLQGGNLKRFRHFAYYAFFFVLYWFFFGQAMFELKDGIYTGGSQNLGDLPFHLGAIFSFTDGNNFPPQNPSWAGAKFSYPFIADLITACFVGLGVNVKDAIFALDLSWAFALLVILERFVGKLTNSKLAGRLAPALLFFSGGVGFIWFFNDFWDSGKGVFDFLRHLPRDYTIGDQFRWGNSLVVLFMTQRSLLLGMPLTVLVLGYLWRIFHGEKVEKGKSEKVAVEDAERRFFTFSHFQIPPFLVGLLAGTLPLIHLHSLAVLFVVTAFLFILRPARWRDWIALGLGVSVIAVPQLIWSMSGSATETAKFFDWHFGWDKRDDNFIWFWVKNTGIVIPAIVAGIWIYLRENLPQISTDKRGSDIQKTKSEGLWENSLLLFYLPFIFLFIVSNAVKLAPWEWDNIKILIYWFVGSVPLIGLALAWAWQQTRIWKLGAAICFTALVFSGALDVWRTASGQIKTKVFDADAVKLAEQIKQRTEPMALFLNAPTYNSAVVLSGRRSLMRYSGHLASHGIDYGPRESDVKKIYEGGGVADILLRKYNVEYVLVSPEELNTLSANDEFFKKYPVLAQSGQYRVYKVK